MIDTRQVTKKNGGSLICDIYLETKVNCLHGDHFTKLIFIAP